MILPHISFPPMAAILATKLLAQADYTIANRVSDDVAFVVEWAYTHHAPWLAQYAIHTLQSLDEAGSWLIACVAYIVTHSQ